RNRGQALHIAGFYLNQIYFEWLVTKSATLFNVKVIYEIRNGGMIQAYQNGGFIYRWFMKSTLLTSTMVLSQGYDYVTFLKETWNKHSYYYPNYIMNSFVQANNISRKIKKEIRLVYLGRVVQEKN